MKRFIVITLTLIIVYLMLKNAEIFRQLILIITDQFNKTFKAVTTAEKF